MSIPPSFSDLGKAARDIFTKGFSKYQCIMMEYLSLYGVHLVAKNISCFSLVLLS